MNKRRFRFHSSNSCEQKISQSLERIGNRKTTTRRRWLGASLAGGFGLVAGGVFIRPSGAAAGYASPNERPGIAVVGFGGRGRALAKDAARFGPVVAVADADLGYAEQGRQFFEGKSAVYQDYRKILDRPDVDVVINATPDHWHTLINVAACKAEKDVYTEKPLTLTIDEGKLLCRVVKQTGRVVQVGTQQRSEAPFRLACELVRNGRVGKLHQVIVLLPFWTTKGGPFPGQPVPPELNWDLYQGQAPERPYHPMRTHFHFRWWFEYAGGIVTDWGQHHMDIAHWGMNVEHTGPREVEAQGYFPNHGQPDCFNNPDRFVARLSYPGPIDLLFLVARDDKYLASMAQGDITPQADAELFAGVPEEWKNEKRNGIMFIGDQGRVFVNRGGVFGKPVEALAEKPLPADAVRLEASDDHMANFFDSVKSRGKPISDVFVGHRTITACHLVNISMRLGRPIRWDPEQEKIIGDTEAESWLSRPQRPPYQLDRI